LKIGKNIKYMRIAFVGKGGSGKSTLSASFAAYITENTTKPVVVFDADLNIHTPELLGFRTIPVEKHLSHPETTVAIKKWLIGKNDIKDLGAFRKTTPPTNRSNILDISKLEQSPLYKFGVHKENLSVFAVGTYQEDGIGSSCYHTNLAIFESLLNHIDDTKGYVIADMVAGIDSFSGTLHAQFDMTCLVVEPTKRSIEVYIKYNELAQEAGVHNQLVVIGNKINSADDKAFIASHIKSEKIIGYFTDDVHIRLIDRDEQLLDIKKLNLDNQDLLHTIKIKLESLPDRKNVRLEKIWELHQKYVSLPFIKNSFGDLTTQIDKSFSFKDSP